MDVIEANGISEAQLKDLQNGGWKDEDVSAPSWMRWVGDAKVGVAWEAQRLFLGSDAWCVFAGPESSDIGVVKFGSLDDALDLCDEWKGSLPVAAAPGETTAQADRF